MSESHPHKEYGTPAMRGEYLHPFTEDEALEIIAWIKNKHVQDMIGSIHVTSPDKKMSLDGDGDTWRYDVGDGYSFNVKDAVLKLELAKVQPTFNEVYGDCIGEIVDMITRATCLLIEEGWVEIVPAIQTQKRKTIAQPKGANIPDWLLKEVRVMEILVCDGSLEDSDVYQHGVEGSIHPALCETVNIIFKHNTRDAVEGLKSELEQGRCTVNREEDIVGVTCWCRNRVKGCIHYDEKLHLCGHPLRAESDHPLELPKIPRLDATLDIDSLFEKQEDI